MTSWRSAGCQPRRCRTQPVQGMQGHRLSGCPPPCTLLFPAGKPVARSSRSPLLGQRGISTRLSPAWLQGSRLGWRPRTALCAGAQQTADGIRRPETCRLRLLCAGKAPKHPDAGRKQLPSPTPPVPRLRAEQSNSFATEQGAVSCDDTRDDRLFAIFFPPHLVHLLEQTGHGDTAAARAWQSLPCGMHRRQQHPRGTPLAAVPCPPPPKPAPAGPAEPSRSSPSASSPAAAAPR